MASSSKAVATYNFFEVQEKRFYVGRLDGNDRKKKGEDSVGVTAVGVSSIVPCIGIYAQITSEHYYIAHAYNGTSSIIESLNTLYMKDTKEQRKQRVGRLESKIKTTITDDIRTGLKEQKWPGSEQWDSENPEYQIYIQESLVVRSNEENIPGNANNGLLNTFKIAIKEWAGIGQKENIPFYFGGPVSGKSQANGFVIPDPSKFSAPIWVSRPKKTEKPNEPKPSYDKGGKAWMGELSSGHGSFALDSMVWVLHD